MEVEWLDEVDDSDVCGLVVVDEADVEEVVT